MLNRRNAERIFGRNAEYRTEQKCKHPQEHLRKDREDKDGLLHGPGPTGPLSLMATSFSVEVRPHLVSYLAKSVYFSY